MQTATHIHPKAAPGLTLAAKRRPRRPMGASSSRARCIGRPATTGTVPVPAARYPDDPVGDYETTAGGW